MEGLRRWEDLDPSILRQIFCQVPYEELCSNVSSVCQSWQAACWDFLIWSRNILDVSAATAGFDEFYSTSIFTKKPKQVFLYRFNYFSFLKEFDSPDKYNQMATKLMRRLQRIMEGDDTYGRSLEDWRLSVRTLIIPYDLPISDRHLVYIAERLPGLECLLLLGASRISIKGFAKAVKNWKHLKVIHFGPVDLCFKMLNNYPIYNHFIKEIGRNCQEHEMLHIHQIGFEVNSINSLVIARSLPGLKKLEVERACLFKGGILTLFRMCHQLEEVILEGNYLLDEFGSISDYEDSSSVDNSIWEVGSFSFHRMICNVWRIKSLSHRFNALLYLELCSLLPFTQKGDPV